VEINYSRSFADSVSPTEFIQQRENKYAEILF
jgi:hypothetical protein